MEESIRPMMLPGWKRVEGMELSREGIPVVQLGVGVEGWDLVCARRVDARTGVEGSIGIESRQRANTWIDVEKGTTRVEDWQKETGCGLAREEKSHEHGQGKEIPMTKAMVVVS